MDNQSPVLPPPLYVHQATAVSGPPPPLDQLLQHQQRQLKMFWNHQRQEMEQASDFKTHLLPLARIKKIMKADEDVRMISAEAPILFAKACELFILELTIRSWLHAEENKRRTLQKNDIAAAIARNDIFDFLVDIVPHDGVKEDAGGSGGGIAAGVPYYYPPAMGEAAGVMMGQPEGVDPGMYMQRPWQPVWQQPMMADGGGGGSFGGEPGFDEEGNYVDHIGPLPPAPPSESHDE